MHTSPQIQERSMSIASGVARLLLLEKVQDAFGAEGGPLRKQLVLICQCSAAAHSDQSGSRSVGRIGINSFFLVIPRDRHVQSSRRTAGNGPTDRDTGLEKRRLLWRLCSGSGLAEFVVVLLVMAALARQARVLMASPVGGSSSAGNYLYPIGSPGRCALSESRSPNAFRLPCITATTSTLPPDAMNTRVKSSESPIPHSRHEDQYGERILAEVVEPGPAGGAGATEPKSAPG
jgi:hypothetical protein